MTPWVHPATGKGWGDNGEHGAEKEGEHGSDQEGEHRGEQVAKHAGKPLLGQPHSPTYAEYDARYPIEWPKKPYHTDKENEHKASTVKSSSDEDYLSYFYRKYEMPKDVSFWAPLTDEQADQTPVECMAVNMDTMEAGLHFLLHLAITRLLVEWNITITQLKPNG